MLAQAQERLKEKKKNMGLVAIKPQSCIFFLKLQSSTTVIVYLQHTDHSSGVGKLHTAVQDRLGVFPILSQLLLHGTRWGQGKAV